MTVKSFKLITGEEILADVVEERSGAANILNEDVGLQGRVTSYIVRKPHVLRFQPVRPGEIGLTLVPYTMSNPEINDLEIPASAVMFVFKPSENAAAQFMEQTSSIKIAKASTLLKA